MLKIYILTFRDRTILKIQMCKSCKQMRSCGSQPGGLLVAVAAVPTAFLQREPESRTVSLKRWHTGFNRSTDLPAKQPLQEALFGRRGRLPSPVQVWRNRPVLVENIQLCEALRLDHLQEKTQTSQCPKLRKGHSHIQ